MAAGVGSAEGLEGSFGEGFDFGDPSPEVLSEAAAAFGLLASSARLHLVWALSQGESDVSGLAERVGGALPAISQHLAKLKLAGLVRSRREGRRVVYLVDDPHVVTIVRLMVGQLVDRRTGAEGLPGAASASRAGSGRLRGLGA
ncbi:ArsR family transcriptional regulator [Streptomyces griseocarneus]|nr:ArsR family transcriptional regulator [Streptomyces griseocarneus]